MILDILLYYLLHIAFTAGLVILFGVVIAKCNSFFYSRVGNNSMAVYYATGFIGTPIHELSHALMCVIFGHKITEIKLFQIDSADGTLGYVKHSYNPRNVYQRIGNFFIGIAPVFVGFIILTALFYAFLPKSFDACIASIASVKLSSGISGLFGILSDLLEILFDCFFQWQWWVFLALGSLIALHMTLSKADWEGAKSGIGLFLIAFAAADVIVALISMDLLYKMTAKIFSFAVFVMYFGIIFIACIFILTAIVALIRKFILKR